MHFPNQAAESKMRTSWRQQNFQKSVGKKCGSAFHIFSTQLSTRSLQLCSTRWFPCIQRGFPMFKKETSIRPTQNYICQRVTPTVLYEHESRFGARCLALDVFQIKFWVIVEGLFGICFQDFEGRFRRFLSHFGRTFGIMLGDFRGLFLRRFVLCIYHIYIYICVCALLDIFFYTLLYGQIHKLLQWSVGLTEDGQTVSSICSNNCFEQIC